MEEITYTKGCYNYVVTYDRLELIKLRIEVVENASVVMHCDYNGPSSKSPYNRKNNNDSLEFKNFKEEYVRTDKTLNGEKEEIYHYEYDSYLFPYIEELITRLLNKDVSALEDIYNPDLVKEAVSIYYQINFLERKLLRTDSRNLDEKIEILHKLEDLVKEAKDTKKDVPVLKYYERLQNMVKIEKIPVLNISWEK